MFNRGALRLAPTPLPPLDGDEGELLLSLSSL